MAPERNEYNHKVIQMYRDVYLGNGKDNPSMMTRVAMIEETLEKLSRYYQKTVWLLVGVLVSMIGEVIVTLISKNIIR